MTVKAAGAAGMKTENKSNKRFLIGCLSAFGCSIILFIAALFGFVAFGSPDNPIFSFLGVPPEEVVGVLTTLINLIFLVLVFVCFILVVVGIFKRVTAKKDDKEAKRKAGIFLFISFFLLFFFIVLWVVAYLFLPKQSGPVRASPITTEPAQTTNLKAPVAVKFDASKLAIDRKTYDVLSYAWDFGDGSEAKGIKQSHTYTDLGEFKAVLTLLLKNKQTGKEESAQYSRDVTIQNVFAKVVIKAEPDSGIAPIKIAFDGSQSTSTNGEITGFSWDFDSDGEFDDGDEATAEYIYEKIGEFTVRLRVTDSTGDFSIGEKTITATASDKPEATIEIEGAQNNVLELNKAYLFSGAKSTSPKGSIEKFSWEFGDGETASTRTVTHAYGKTGEYEVLLRVTDNGNKTGELRQRIRVEAAAGAPTATIKTSPAARENVIGGEAPFEVTFDASDSADPNGNIVEYQWDFENDKKFDASNKIATHTFTEAGTYTVTLKTTDTSDLFATAQVIVKVQPQGLRVRLTAEPVSGSTPLTVRFDASGSTYPSGQIVSYEWDFGDGGRPRIDNAQVAYQYTSVGTFTAKVTAITSDNKRGSFELPINVRPVSLNACFEPSTQSGAAPLTVVFDPTCSTGTIVKYKWDFAGLKNSTDRKPSYTFGNPGTFDVELEVVDNENVVDTFSQSITVTESNE